MSDVPEGFQVVEAYETEAVGDLKEERQVMPPFQNVKFRIQKAAVRENLQDNKQPKSADNPCIARAISLELRLVDGVNAEGKYKNKPLFVDVTNWADLTVKTSDWYKNRQYLIQWQYLLRALGYDLNQPIQITDEWVSGLVGRELLANITVEKTQVFDETTGKYTDDGGQRNRVKGFKAA